LTIGLLVLKMTRHQPTASGETTIASAGLILASRLLTPDPLSR
jgi:hypothetical protein